MVKDNKNQKRKEFVIVAFACFICLSALAVGATVINKKDKKTDKGTENVVDLNETTNHLENESTKNTETTLDMAVDGKVSKNTENESETQAVPKSTFARTSDGESVTKPYSESQEDDSVGVSSKVATLKFDKDSKLNWPVQGNVILDYSMDTTIYFPTLDAYKCNPSIVIQGEAGTKVFAGVNAIVKETNTNDEIGNYVVLSLGGDYELTIGQLENVELKTGDSVNADTTIGVIANPTRYYSKEGSNLYYKLTHAGEPCDPLDYLS